MRSGKMFKAGLAATISTIPLSVQAEPVELRHESGLVTISGEILSFDGTTLMVATSAGDVSVPAAEVTCAGNDCPEGVKLSAIEEAVSIAVMSPENLSLAQSYLTTTTATSSRSARAGDTVVRNETQDQIAKVSFVPSAQSDQGDIIITNVISDAAAANRTGTIAEWTLGSTPTQLLAIKALSVVTSPEIGVDHISMPELAQVLAGEITNWSQLGGNDLNIIPIQAAAGTRLHADVQATVLDPARKPASPMVFSMADASAIMTGLSTLPGGMSIVPTEMVGATNTLDIVDSCGVTHAATDFEIRAGDYPLTVPTLAVHNTPLETQVMHAAFDKAASVGIPDMFEEADFSPHTLMQLPTDDNDWRVANIMSQQLDADQKQSAIKLIQLLANAQQLSAAFTDGELTQTEGAWTRAHFVRLRDAIQSGVLDDKEIHFVGFHAQNIGADAVLSTQTAAENILAAFQAFAPDAANRPNVTLAASGYGHLGATGCLPNGATTARDTRIEIWTRPAG